MIKNDRKQEFTLYQKTTIRLSNICQALYHQATVKQESSLYNKITLKLFKTKKGLYQRLFADRQQKKQIVFILGCQRSGTTMLTKKIIERDLNTKIFGETSILYTHDKPTPLRFNPLHIVKTTFDKCYASMVVAKPLVECQNTIELLNYFSEAKAIWMYRDYHDVASSIMVKWGAENSVANINAIVQNNTNDWRTENVSDRVREVVTKHFSTGMNPYDAAALFWFARNSLFFELGLDINQRVMICKYEALSAQPAPLTQQIYKFLNVDYPGDQLISEVHASSVRKGKNIKLSTKIESLCTELLQRLDRYWKK